MSRKPSKTAVVAFKVEAELAEFLNKLPNKSAFIRKSIFAQMKMACPLCNGSGVVSRGVHNHFAPLIDQFSSRNCDSCGTMLPLPNDPGELSADHRHRLEQFFHGDRKSTRLNSSHVEISYAVFWLEKKVHTACAV